MKLLTAYISWICLALAIFAWVGVWFAAHAIRAQALSSASSAQSTDQQAQRLAYQQRIAALALDTEEERAQLDALADHDIVSTVTLLENAGKNIGVTVRINDAQIEPGVQDLPEEKKLRPIQFVVEARGSFASLMRLVSVYEHLPLISSLRHVELGRVNTETSASEWSLIMRVRVYTSAELSI